MIKLLALQPGCFMPYISYILGALAILGMIVFIVRYHKNTKYGCRFCDGIVDEYEDLPRSEKNKIMTYFSKYEDRVPFPDSIVVCQTCKRVEDDSFRAWNQFSCKACRALDFLNHEPRLNAELKCSTCGMEFVWTRYEGCGDYLYLVPAVEGETHEEPAIQPESSNQASIWK